MKNRKKRFKISLISCVMLFCLLLTSCDTEHETLETAELSEIQAYDGGNIHGVEYGKTYDGYLRSVVEAYSYTNAYYGYYWDEDLYYQKCSRSILGHKVTIPELNLYVDERLLYCFEYDKKTYPEAKNAFSEALEMSEEPVEEFNGYVFYDSFISYDSRFPYDFNRAAFNDSKNTIILLGFYYGHTRALYEANYTWPELLEVVYGEWYSFSE